MQPKRSAPILLFLTVVFITPVALAQAASPIRIEVLDQGFQPATVQVPAGKRVQLSITNKRKIPSEFESFPLNREKIVPPGGTIRVWIGPLDPGHYKFFDDFNPDKTGEVIVRPVKGDGENAQ